MSRMRKDSKTASLERARGRQVAVKAAALTKRDGGVRSPVRHQARRVAGIPVVRACRVVAV